MNQKETAWEFLSAQNAFGSAYADQYDALYKDKDYQAECDLLRRVFQQYAARPVHSILDLGCGTGNHAIPLAQRGFQVTGVDRSTEMLERARQKARAAALSYVPEFIQGDVRQVELGKTSDAALFMFAVLGYQLSNTDVLAALQNARRHLEEDGLLVFDIWYGPAVLHLRPAERMKIIDTPQGEVIRWASGELDIRHHLCRVTYRLWNLAGGALRNETTETHWMRYFFPMELEMLLSASGFELMHMGAFPQIDREPGENTWNVLCVAKSRAPL
jgi:SAM-dependent methyltransferase